MEYSLLGPTGVKVSKICLGTATFGVAPDAQEAGRVVHAALDLGINFFDTAKVYGATPSGPRRLTPNATSWYENSHAHLAWAVAIDEQRPPQSVLEPE